MKKRKKKKKLLRLKVKFSNFQVKTFQWQSFEFLSVIEIFDGSWVVFM